MNSDQPADWLSGGPDGVAPLWSAGEAIRGTNTRTLEEATKVRRRQLRARAGKWALAAVICVLVVVVGTTVSIGRPSLQSAMGWVGLVAVFAVPLCLLIALGHVVYSLFATGRLAIQAARPRVGMQRTELLDSLQGSRLVIRPSMSAYATGWLRNLSVGALLITLIVTVYRVITVPGIGIAVVAAAVALGLLAALYFFHAKIVLDHDNLSYRRFFVTRRFPLTRVGGIAIGRIGPLRFSYAARAVPYAVVYDTDGKALFSLSASLWPAADLERLREVIGGESGQLWGRARNLQAEIPRSLPWWILLIDGHPIWTLVIGTPLMLLAIVLGILISDLLTTGKP